VNANVFWLQLEGDVVAIGKKGKRNAAEDAREHGLAFKLGQASRAGIEGTLSFVKTLPASPSLLQQGVVALRGDHRVRRSSRTTCWSLPKAVADELNPQARSTPGGFDEDGPGSRCALRGRGSRRTPNSVAKPQIRAFAILSRDPPSRSTSSASAMLNGI